jgi:hypothetical protein
MSCLCFFRPSGMKADMSVTSTTSVLATLLYELASTES